MANYLIEAGDLVWMRQTPAELMNEVATIYQVQNVADGSGGWTPTPVLTSTVACRVASATHRPPDETLVIGKGGVRTESYYTIRFPWGTVIGEQYRVTVNGITYEVAGLQNPKNWDIDVRVYATRLT